MDLSSAAMIHLQYYTGVATVGFAVGGAMRMVEKSLNSGTQIVRFLLTEDPDYFHLTMTCV